jgi:transcriptional regulator with XRE-family HTH domain
MDLRKFGAYLRSTRVALNASLVETARAARVAESSLCDIEKGRRRPSLRVARRLAMYLGLELDDVLARAGILTPRALAYLRRTPALVRRINREAHLAVAA